MVSLHFLGQCICSLLTAFHMYLFLFHILIMNCICSFIIYSHKVYLSSCYRFSPGVFSLGTCPHKVVFLSLQILTRCIKEFGHEVPNPELSEINTNVDLIKFYSTPVRDTNSYEDLAQLDLPRNLHIQLNYLRFDPDNDPMFGGVNAFPGRPTIVTGLRAKKKYKGTNVPRYWPDQHLKD